MLRNLLCVGLSVVLGCSSSSSPIGTESGGGGANTSGGASLSGGTNNGATSSGGTPGSGGGAGTLSGLAGSGAGGATAGAATTGGSPSGGAATAGSGGGAGGDSGGAGNLFCLPSAGGAGGAGATGLSAKYANCFPIGAAVDASSYTTHGPILKAHFNSVTPENEMKFDSLQHNEGSFSYAAADGIVNFARSNNMRVRGHALVWHSQNPSWLFTNGSGGSASAATLLARMKSHISNVVGHFKGKAYAWDVVNEAFMSDGSYRDGTLADDQKSQWYAILGKSYIAEAFKAAHAADPDAKLFYNDFYDYIPAKQQAIHDMLKELLEAGVPVHGVGMQCHLNIQPSTDPTNQAYYQDVKHLEDAIKLYSSLGLEVQVTEMDVSLYIPGVTYTQETFYTAATFTDELKTKQAARYREFFELFRKYKGVITGVTLWGIADDNTWLSEFTSKRKDFPLLFDDSHNPKKSYDAVMDF